MIFDLNQYELISSEVIYTTSSSFLFKKISFFSHSIQLYNIKCCISIIFKKMEKSMIQNLRGFSSPQPLSPRSTFTTTINDAKGYQMKKSRINNLPGHTKLDMSSKVPFIVVFQTMQIQRLSLQIEALRVALKDSQRQAFNCQSYEYQIKELTQQCENYEKERSMFKKEIDQITFQNQQLQAEIHRLKKTLERTNYEMNEKQARNVKNIEELIEENERIRNLLQEASKENETTIKGLRQNMKVQCDTILESRVHDIDLVHKNQKKYLQDELKRLQEQNEVKDSEINKLLEEKENLNEKVQEKINLQTNKKQLENKVSDMVEDILKYSDNLSKSKEQNDKLKQDIQYFLAQLKTLQDKNYQLQLENTKVSQLTSFMEAINTKYNNLQEENQRKDEKLKNIPSLQENLYKKQNEIDQINNLLHDKEKNLYQLDKKCKRYQQSVEELKKMQQEIPKLQRKLTQSNYEKDRLVHLLQLKNNQLDEVNRRREYLEEDLIKLEKIVPEKQKFKEQNEQKQKEINKLSKEIQDYELVLEDQRKKSNEFLKQIQALNVLVKQQLNNISQLDSKLSQETNNYQSVSQEIYHYKSERAEIQQKLQKMERILDEKIEQLNDTKETLNDLQNQIQRQSFKSLKLKEKLNESLCERQKLFSDLQSTRVSKNETENQLFSMENSIRQINFELINMKQENQILKSIITKKDKELEGSKEENQNLSIQIKQLRMIQSKYYNLKNQMKELSQKYHKYELQLKALKDNNESLNQKCQNYKYQLEKMHKKGYFPTDFREKFTKIKKQNQEKDLQLVKLNKRLLNLQRMITKLKSKFQSKKQLSFNNNKKWSNTANQIVKYIDEMKEIGGLKNQIFKLMEENLVLEGTVKAMNLQMIQTQNRRTSLFTNTTNLSRQSMESFAPIENISFTTKGKGSTREPFGFKSTQLSNFR